jgi:hypothetical protein
VGPETDLSMTTCDFTLPPDVLPSVRGTTERLPDPPVNDPPAPVEQPVPVEEPPPGEPPTQEPPVGPDEVEAPVRDPRVPGTPTRKEASLTSSPRPSDKS